MGVKQSIYEKPDKLDYYRFSAAERALIKKVWSEIDINPRFHGNAYLKSFCEAYPQYTKFFTLELGSATNYDARSTSKFTRIIEALGYILLDYNDKPKQLDRFVGYLAMMHKDMRLDERDMRNIISFLFVYLSETFPTQMTVQCQEAISKYMDAIAKELSKKMDTFRGYDSALLDVTTQSKWPRRWCPYHVDPLIFGKTKFHWNEWRKQWDARLDEWAARGSVAWCLEPILNEENTVTGASDDGSRNSISKQKASGLMDKPRVSDTSAARLALSSPDKTLRIEVSSTRRHSIHREDDCQEQRSTCPRKSASSRARHRAKNLDASNVRAEEKEPRSDRAIVDPPPSRIVPEADEDTKIGLAPELPNIARERRRRRFTVDHLKSRMNS